MTEPAEWTVALVEGLAAYLADAGLGVWRPDGPAYTANETAIAVFEIPPDPDRCIVLIPYPVSQTPTADEAIAGVEIHVRAPGPATAACGLGDRVYDALMGLAMADLGEVSVSQVIYRYGEQPGAAAGPDANGRHKRFDNFYVFARRVSPHYI